MSNFILYQGALPIPQIYTQWYELAKDQNCGTLLTFCGIVREEKEIQGLSFDIYESLLKKWFNHWQEEVKSENITLLFAHSIGNVNVHESSYIAGIISKQRKIGLKLINDFVEDFKANAPIWKYDVINKERIYAKERSKKLYGAGILKG
ncbi:molybdenum cofactor biosynthesis protein MoaE [Campylobacter hepaticus]|uniref:Molybdopterin synthase catalytic subunit n=1 Tax=Campylobacter hepaticus TaxID=1813019 RepID=A0A6A7JSQ1_9BACT|nr:molybdenum cofactor biosynthesis protein MoaE [Campylobacter hepaticus]AXP08880.1 molybdenum cofactor biosynthesis protein MoaE [Campylobacter hepaticus]MCZ0771834.1 molybdenum cofactor biosynthesis protein MoaE [Campylobacter hepaticus]MCZ0773299.1 molybdenum cofactor biosynthesis protein MoaE [Campylobacter hepaticus]MCZ0774550.1 molybdenum cofactor biosynthesis protein MoaE [Campylobacter hepaticus]MDX2323864.1 molybdenum cofactor biosynthesis protein MoaE [Campylobacter hepaticus]